MSVIEMERLHDRGSQVIDRSRSILFEFNGRSYRGHAGDTVGSALYASGVHTFSRSFKYHRPRGLFCVNGRCPNCLCNVDGTPNVRVCTTPIQAGMRVRGQNAWPSVERDAMSVIDTLSPLLPVGFYYKTFIQPRAMWPIYEAVLRRAAGLGVVDTTHEPQGDYVHEYRHTDLAVVGGGPAGLAAALEAARLGADVTLIDDQLALGGHLRAMTRDDGTGVGEIVPGYARASALAAQVAAAGVNTLLGSTAFGAYEGNLLGIFSGKRLIELRYRSLVVATGQQDRPLLFQNNDLPGIMLASGAQRLMHLYGVSPGRRAVVVSTSNAGLEVARDLLEAGLMVAAVADSRPQFDESDPTVRMLRARSVPLLNGHSIVAAQGKGAVSGVVLSPLDSVGVPVGGVEIQVTCDLVVLATGSDPMASLLGQAGCTLQFDTDRDRLLPITMADAVFAAGEVAGATGTASLLEQGRQVGAQAAASAGVAGAEAQAAGSSPETPAAAKRGKRSRDAAADEAPSLAKDDQAPNGADSALPAQRALLSTAPSPKKSFVCLCEDVTEKDIISAIEEGFDHIETLKRYSTVTMGPCQGKMCHPNAIALTARENRVDRVRTGMTTARPPAQPVELGSLAGSLHEPARLSSMHHAHLRLGAEIMDLGEWKRARAYSTPADEVNAVRQRVGIIDVSSLGKLEVRGRDAAKLLDRIYLNTFSDLKVGRIRYGVIADDSGIVLDDGTIARLDEERFYVSTTTSGVTMVEEWLNWWLAGSGQCVHVTNQTSATSAINLAGPRAREVLQKLTSADVSKEAAPYLSAVQADVAGVPVLMLRIGFVGELGYEMHFPSEYGDHLWDALLDAGREFGIRPFGVEAQRILRLEKGHLIVGQDTDALTNPFEAGMPWIVKMQKPDFIGKPALVQAKERGDRNKLVGYRMLDSTLVPEEGSVIEFGGRPIGRVTSARSSPTLGSSIGMGWVPKEMATEGTALRIRVSGQPSLAEVVKLPFYDPDGSRMKA